MAAEEASYVVMNNDGPLSPGAQHRQKVQNVLREMKTGVTTQWKPKVVIGMKVL